MHGDGIGEPGTGVLSRLHQPRNPRVLKASKQPGLLILLRQFYVLTDRAAIEHVLASGST
jgi:hypothetical protein